MAYHSHAIIVHKSHPLNKIAKETAIIVQGFRKGVPCRCRNWGISYSRWLFRLFWRAPNLIPPGRTVSRVGIHRAVIKHESLPIQSFHGAVAHIKIHKKIMIVVVAFSKSLVSKWVKISKCWQGRKRAIHLSADKRYKG